MTEVRASSGCASAESVARSDRARAGARRWQGAGVSATWGAGVSMTWGAGVSRWQGAECGGGEFDDVDVTQRWRVRW